MSDVCLWSTARIKAHFVELGAPVFAAHLGDCCGAALLALSNADAAAGCAPEELAEVLGELTALRSNASAWPAARCLVSFAARRACSTVLHVSWQLFAFVNCSEFFFYCDQFFFFSLLSCGQNNRADGVPRTGGADRRQ